MVVQNYGQVREEFCLQLSAKMAYAFGFHEVELSYVGSDILPPLRQFPGHRWPPSRPGTGRLANQKAPGPVGQHDYLLSLTADLSETLSLLRSTGTPQRLNVSSIDYTSLAGLRLGTNHRRKDS